MSAKSMYIPKNETGAMLTKYAQRITEIYNEHAKLYEKALEDRDMVEESVHALVCNAINNRVLQSSYQEVKDYFSLHAIAD